MVGYINRRDYSRYDFVDECWSTRSDGRENVWAYHNRWWARYLQWSWLGSRYYYVNEVNFKGGDNDESDAGLKERASYMSCFKSR